MEVRVDRVRVGTSECVQCECAKARLWNACACVCVCVCVYVCVCECEKRENAPEGQKRDAVTWCKRNGLWETMCVR